MFQRYIEQYENYIVYILYNNVNVIFDKDYINIVSKLLVF